MDDKARAALKEKIEATITSLEKEIVQLEEASEPVSPDNSIGRITRMDAINNKGVAEANLRTARRKLTNLKIALGKIDSPSFGLCSSCGKGIQPARLMYMPESALCVRCAD